MTSLRVTGLTKEFASRRGSVHRAIDGLNLSVDTGEFVVLLGPSGCGKTTTLRCVAGLEQPTSGSIEIGGVAMFSPERRINLSPNKRDIGMVFQSYALWPHLTVRQNLEFPLRARRLRSGLTSGWAVDAARLVECDDLLERYPSQLSGGQQQRVALARALVARPSLVLFDEPLSNLDARLRTQLRQDIHALHVEVGFTALYVTHDQEEALALGNRLVVMRDGAIEQVGTPEDLYERPTSEYVAGFMGATNSINLEWLGGTWVSDEWDIVTHLPAPGRGPTQARISFRPDDLRIVEGTPQASGALLATSARVVDVSYGGSHLDLRLASTKSSVTIQARIPVSAAPDSVKLGGSVAVHIQGNRFSGARAATLGVDQDD